MSTLLTDLTPLIAGIGVVIASAVLVRTHRLSVALPVLLDFLLAAGLLRLTAAAPWRAIITVAVIVLLRKVVTWSLGRTAPTPGSQLAVR
ncbi:DUF1622 domain-containing protein [Rhodococcus sp. H36-A4]|uniref:DUF1622 domain-containing protein n=1 Tax=Rhodococcus sp. H36-A4 TaxID=3004353 RepID=UPI0022AE9ECE|nr:DUF1622 domain-containing protein [Rhodococcus sp. H36-A4]MCZ4076500.1 DUF1622 domain-containing protein [Rhodococcus sp. H36-A4]